MKNGGAYVPLRRMVSAGIQATVAPAEAPSHPWQEKCSRCMIFKTVMIGAREWGGGRAEGVYAELSFHVMLLSFIEDFDI